MYNNNIVIKYIIIMENPSKLPIIKVKGKRQQLSKTVRNPTVKKSTFHLTVNTNQQYKKDDPNLENDIDIFEASVESLLQNIDKYVNLPPGDIFSEKVLDADIDYAVEVGGKRGQIHTHILLKFKHNTKLLLNYAAIKQHFKDALGIDVYMRNQLVNNGSDNVEDYINKYT
jgi:hypothetical protein